MKILTSVKDIVRKGCNFHTYERGKYIVLVSWYTPIAYYNTETGILHRTWSGWSKSSMNHVRKCFRLGSMTQAEWFGMRLEKKMY